LVLVIPTLELDTASTLWAENERSYGKDVSGKTLATSWWMTLKNKLQVWPVSIRVVRAARMDDPAWIEVKSADWSLGKS
jgi:hypothetical protein